MRTTSEDKKNQYRIIYELLYEDWRVKTPAIAKAIKSWRKIASVRLRDAFDQGYISDPQVRKRCFKNFREYMYVVNCEDALETYLELIEDENVVYHATMNGFANLWVISTEKMIIEGNIIAGGPLSDYHVSYAPDHNWETSVGIMNKEVKNFKPANYEPKGVIKTHFDETVKWDEEDEILYRYFKDNLRKPLTPILKEHKISIEKINEWFSRLPECCTIMVGYYPETRSAYDSYLFMFETDYEDFIIDLFSELPTSVSFFKVSGKLITYTHLRRDLLRSSKLPVPEIEELHVPLLIRELSKKEIVKSRARAIVNYHWRKDI
jgi:hypothetical protein